MDENNQKITISLVSPPTRANIRYIPVNLIYLAAWLDKEGLDNNIIDIKIKRDPFVAMKKKDIDETSKKIVEEIKKIKPPFVGIPCYTIDYTTVMPLAESIKRTCNTKIIIGGIHTSLKPEDFLFNGSPVDFIVRGEGEIALTELIKTYQSGLPLKDIKGIAYLDQGEMITTEDQEPIKDLSILPRPAYEKLDMEYYLKPTRYIIRMLLSSGLHIFTTRGCPYQCTFCANRMKKVTYRPITAVIDEIRWLRENYDLDSFYIADDTFCLRKERAYEFIDALKKIPHKFIWAMETTVRSADDQMIKALKKARCLQIDYGVESGSQTALNRMKKGITIDQIEKAFRLCRKHRVRTYATLMFNTPQETEEDVKETINLMKRIKATNYGINLTVPFVGTEVYEEFVSPKLTKEEYHLYNEVNLFRSIPDKRFRLAEHKLNLAKLYIKVLLRFKIARTILDLTWDKNYWWTLLKSKRRADYFVSFIENLKREIGVFYDYFLRLITPSSK